MFRQLLQSLCFNSGFVLRPKMYQTIIKHLSQNGSKSFENPSKSEPKVVQNRSQSGLGTLLDISEALWRVRVPSVYHFGSILSPSWDNLGTIWDHVGPGWGHLGSIWNHWGTIWDHLG